MGSLYSVDSGCQICNHSVFTTVTIHVPIDISLYDIEQKLGLFPTLIESKTINDNQYNIYTANICSFCLNKLHIPNEWDFF